MDLISSLLPSHKGRIYSSRYLCRLTCCSWSVLLSKCCSGWEWSLISSYMMSSNMATMGDFSVKYYQKRHNTSVIGAYRCENTHKEKHYIHIHEYISKHMQTHSQTHLNLYFTACSFIYNPTPKNMNKVSTRDDYLNYTNITARLDWEHGWQEPETQVYHHFLVDEAAIISALTLCYTQWHHLHKHWAYFHCHVLVGWRKRLMWV